MAPQAGHLMLVIVGGVDVPMEVPMVDADIMDDPIVEGPQAAFPKKALTRVLVR